MPDFSRPENRRVLDRDGQEVRASIDHGDWDSEVSLVIATPDRKYRVRTLLDAAQARQLIGALKWAVDQVEGERDG